MQPDHFDHHDFASDVEELMEDYGVDKDTALDIARQWMQQTKSNNPQLYAELERNHASDCKHCQQGGITHAPAVQIPEQ